MNDQVDFFSPRHKQLLSIATWAKYLAWVVLISYIVGAALVPFQAQGDYQRTQAAFGTYAETEDYWEVIKAEPLYYSIDLGSSMALILLRGIVFYLVLKSISLSLNMIVETDINYRDKENRGVAS